MYVNLFSTPADEPNLPEIAQLHSDLKTLEAQVGSDHDDVSSTVTQLHQNVSEYREKV